MKLVTAIKGDLNKAIQEKNKKILKAVGRAVSKTSNDLKKEMVSQTQKAKLGYGLAKSLRVKVYNRNSADKFPKGLVYTKSPHIMVGFESGGIRTPKKGKWLAFPTNNVPKSTRKRNTPANLPKSFPEIYVAEDSNGKAYLVGETLYNNKGKIKKATKKREAEAETVIYFFLVKQTRNTKKLSFERAKKQHQKKLKLYIREFL